MEIIIILYMLLACAIILVVAAFKISVVQDAMKDEIDAILEETPDSRQTLLFSVYQHIH